MKSGEEVCKIDSNLIYKLKDVEFIHLHEEAHSIENNEISSFIQGLKNLLSLGFYFSFTYHITHTRQKISKFPKNSCPHEKAEEKYFWNYNLYSEFRENKVDNVFYVVLICGFAGSVADYINDKEGLEDVKNKVKNSKDFSKVEIILISKRSVNHAGTRYLTRGVNDDGHVANYVETEQIVCYADHILSFVQIRGSAPIFFSQPGMTAQTIITRSPEMISPAFLKHMKEAINGYSMLFMINLMNANKPGEQIITSNVEKQIKINDLKNLRYLFFDFQTQTKFENYEKLETFTSTNYLKEILEYFKFFCENVKHNNILKEQLGVVRTNCLDCLDRTNVIQTRIAWRVIEIQLTYLNINVDSLFGTKFINTTNPHPLMDKFKTLWAEMGDYISIQYAGSASTITSITKTGKHGIFGLFQHGLASITRFYQGSFEDSFKQKCIELFLQIYKTNQIKALSPLIEEELKNQESRFKAYSNLKIFIGTWNVAASSPDSLTNLNEWLHSFVETIDQSVKHDSLNSLDSNTNNTNSNPPDIYIVGFQEIVDLNANSMFISANTDIAKKWKKLVKSTVSGLDKYSLLKTMDLVGLYLIILVKDSIKENIKHLDFNITKTGMLGTVGNKGSLIAKFNYEDTSLAFVCSHLTHGITGNKNRINELHEILNKSFMVRDKELLVRDFDYYFLFGDLNFRIDYEDQEIRSLISKGDYENLLKYDQLKAILKSAIFNDLLHEPDISFDPTYKYTIGTCLYDSTKKRSPAWCDRILTNSNPNLKLQKYGCVMSYTQSDHKPVFAVYGVRVASINYKERDKVIEEIKCKGHIQNEGTDISRKL